MAQVYWPFPTSRVTEWPGPRRNSYHYGTDFGVPQGTPLRATVDGRIVRHNNDGLGAYVLDIIADDGLLVRNGHLSRMDVNTGDRVRAGQVIGLTGGQPGTPGAGHSFGPHLHWELRNDRLWSGGRWIDPRNLSPQPLTFGQEPEPEYGDDEMYSKVIIGGAHYLWNMASGEYRWIDTQSDNAQISANMKAYSFGSEAEFKAFREKYPFALRVGSSAGGTVDANAIAKAVNDDVARRMQS